VYQFLSGVRVTPSTKFLSMTNSADLALLSDVRHYMYFALGVYGWPMYVRRVVDVAAANGTPAGTALCELCGAFK